MIKYYFEISGGIMKIIANRDRIVQLFCSLAAIRSPLLETAAIMDYLKTLLAGEFSCRIEFDEAGMEDPGYETGNMLVTIEATMGWEGKPWKCVEAHVDTVAVLSGKTIVPTVNGDVIRSDGTTILGADDKAGVAAILEALRLIQTYDIPHGPLKVLFTVGEETSMKGVRQMDPGRLGSTPILSVDGLESNIVWRGCAAKLKYRATFQGKEGHGAFPEAGLNTILMATQAIELAKSRGNYGNPYWGLIDDEVDKRVWHNLSEIKSDLVAGSAFPATNVIPNKVVVCGELRSFDLDRMNEIFEEVRGAFRQTALSMYSNDGIHQGSVSIEVEKPYTPFLLASDHPLVKSVLDAMCGAGVECCHSALTPGSTHSNVFAGHGIDGVVIGAGCRNPHSTDEHVVIAEMCQAAEVVAHYLTGS